MFEVKHNDRVYTVFLRYEPGGKHYGVVKRRGSDAFLYDYSTSACRSKIAALNKAFDWVVEDVFKKGETG